MFTRLTTLACALLAISAYASTPNVTKPLGIVVVDTIPTPTTTLVKALNENPALKLNMASIPNLMQVTVLAKFTKAQLTYDTLDQAFRVSSYRTDLKEMQLPSKDLTSWAEFKQDGKDIRIRGALVVTQNQINPMLALLLKNHLTVIGLHDHVGNESPGILYLNFIGEGNEKQVASAIGQAFEFLKQGGESEEFPLALLDGESTTFNTRLVDHLLGSAGKMQDGVYRIGAKQKLKNLAAKANSEISFSGSDESAVVEGDLVLNQDQLQNILPILNQSGISIIAIKEHDPNKTDRIVEIHYYGVGKVAGLAKGLQKVLSTTSS